MLALPKQGGGEGVVYKVDFTKFINHDEHRPLKIAPHQVFKWHNLNKMLLLTNSQRSVKMGGGGAILGFGGV